MKEVRPVIPEIQDAHVGRTQAGVEPLHRLGQHVCQRKAGRQRLGDLRQDAELEGVSLKNDVRGVGHSGLCSESTPLEGQVNAAGGKDGERRGMAPSPLVTKERSSHHDRPAVG